MSDSEPLGDRGTPASSRWRSPSAVSSGCNPASLPWRSCRSRRARSPASPSAARTGTRAPSTTATSTATATAASASSSTAAARMSPTRRSVVLAHPADVIEPDASETPVSSLPDEVLSFVMPSRFCLPDELGHEAWQRFGDLRARLGTGAGDRRLRPRPPAVRARRVQSLDDRRRRLPRPARASVATSPTWRSRSAAR